MGALALTGSVSFYGAYLGMACVLCVLLFMQKLFVPDDAEHAVKKAVFFALKAMATVLLGLLLYAALLKVMLGLLNIQLPNTYNSINRITSITRVSLLKLAKDAGLLALRVFFQPYSQRPEWMRWCVTAMAALTVLNMLFLALRQRGRGEKWKLRALLTFLAYVGLPFSASVVYVISKGIMHELMTAPIYFLSFLSVLSCHWISKTMPVCASEGRKPAEGRMRLYGERAIRASRGAVALLLCACLWENALFSNAIYLKKRVEWDATLSLITRVVDRIEQYPGYTPGETQVAIIGDPTFNSAYTVKNELFSDLRGGEGNYAKYSITYPSTITNLVSKALNNNILIKDVSADAELMALVEKMPTFPAADSVAFITPELLAVRLGEHN